MVALEAQRQPVAHEMEPYAQDWYDDICSYKSIKFSGERHNGFGVLFARLSEQKRGECLSLTRDLPLSTNQRVAFMRLSSDFTQRIEEAGKYFKELAFEGQDLRIHLPTFYIPESIDNAMLLEANYQAHEAIKNRNSLLRDQTLCSDTRSQLVQRISYRKGAITVKGIDPLRPMNDNQSINPGPTFSVRYEKSRGRICVDDPGRHITNSILSSPVKIAESLASSSSFKLVAESVGILLSPEHFHTEHSVLDIFTDQPFNKVSQMLKHDIEFLEDEDAIRFMQCFFAESFHQAAIIGRCLIEVDKLSDQELRKRMRYIMPFKDLFKKAKQSNFYNRVLTLDVVQGIANAYIFYGPQIQKWADEHNGKYPQELGATPRYSGADSSPWPIIS